MSRFEEESGDVKETPTIILSQKPAVSVSSSTDEGIGCILTAGAFSIVLWALYTYGVPLAKYILGG